ncbi:MAG: glycine--tRNA ligase subunit beta [Desulfovibrio sp.]|jgi:glycyl-tRNA synthetase beta chain|nr:glycine--tRNA ligase subunit beta [Desulfovibrio sp.]
MATFLLEIGSEELPSRFLEPEETELRERFTAVLDEAGLVHGPLCVMSTPRRAVVIVEDVQPVQQEKEELVTGPSARAAFDPDGAPTKALEGFTCSNGLSVDAVFRIQTKKGEYMAVRKRTGGASAAEILANLCPAILSAMSFAKRMRWGAYGFAWGRPLRWILALLDGEVIPFSLGPIQSGRRTFGHRVHGFGPFDVSDAWAWRATLTEQGAVTPDGAGRRKRIVEGGDALAHSVGGKVLWKDNLLAEVQGLTEHPVPLLGDFDSDYLEVPREVLLTSMEIHQKSFGLEAGDGSLMPHFLTVLNLMPQDMPLVKNGWERVLRARLEDARFFWRADLKENFDLWLAKLDQVIFIGNLGSMGDKTRRLEKLCRSLAQQCAPDLAQAAARAGRLSKADLVTGLVNEFDDLQGVMGGIYAGYKGESPEVARALREQYLPAGPDYPLPQSLTGALLALADKADTLTGCFGLNMTPTGAADPNGLRRCALGIIRIVQAFGLDLDIRSLFAEALRHYAGQGKTLPKTETLYNLMEFMAGRLRGHILARGEETQLADAALNAGINRIGDCMARLAALTAFSREDSFVEAVRTFKRVANIIRKQGDAPTSTSGQTAGQWDDALLAEDAEKTLAATLRSILPHLDALWAGGDHAAALACLTELRPAVDAFFDGVMVMCEDAALRNNRLAMLCAMRFRFARIADFAALQL